MRALPVVFAAVLVLVPTSGCRPVTPRLPAEGMTPGSPSKEPALTAIGPMEAPFSLSPDGRWLAYFRAAARTEEGPAQPERLVFRDLRSGAEWERELRARELQDRALLWRRDGGACWVAAGNGWEIVRPAEREVEKIGDAPGVAYESCADWSPRTGKLAVFESETGSGAYRVWDGARVRTPVDWPQALNLPPDASPWRAWQCEWSPDEELLLFRFYGSSGRTKEASGHLQVLDPVTAAPAFRWGAEAGTARWLDDRTLLFRDDDHGIGSTPTALVTAEPRTGRRRTVLPEVVAWELSRDRKTVWALTAGGDLHRLTAPALERGKPYRPFARIEEGITPLDCGLTLSPRGDQLVLLRFGSERTDVSVLSTATGRVVLTRVERGTVQVLGWMEGDRLPLLAFRTTDPGPWKLRRLSSGSGVRAGKPGG